jgi:hypothetical protein
MKGHGRKDIEIFPTEKGQINLLGSSKHSGEHENQYNPKTIHRPVFKLLGQS